MITITFKRKWKKHPVYAVYDTRINGVPFRVKIEKKGEAWQQIEGNRKLLYPFLMGKLYQEIDLKINA